MKTSFAQRWARDGRLRWATLIATATVMLFLGATHRELHAIDVYYADITLHILRSGEWFTLHAFDEGGSKIGAYVNKPPLQFWLSALVMKVFGVSTFAMAIVPRLLGVMSVVLTAALGQRLFGRGVGWLAGIILLTTGPFLGPATDVLMDQGLVAGSLLAVWGGLQPGIRGPLLAVLGIALGTWIKGPQTFLALIPLIAYAAGGGYLRWPWQACARRWCLLVPLLPLAAAWQISLPYRLGDGVTKRWVADATTDPNHVIWQWGPYFSQLWKEYVNPFLLHLPWMPFLVDGAIRLALRFRAWPAHRRAATALLLAWLVSVTIAAVALRMQTRYIMPLLPAAAIVSAWSIMRFARWRLPGWAPASIAVLAGILLVISVVVPQRIAPITLPTIAKMQAYVDQELPKEQALPIMQPTKDGNWWDVAWCRFYLRREAAGRTIPEPGQLALVSRYNFHQLPPDMAVDEIMRSRYIVLVRRRATESDRATSENSGD